MPTEAQVRIASKMYEARSTLKRLCPDVYASRVAEWQKLIKKQMGIANQDAIPSAMVICGMLPDNDAFGKLWVLAAVVEMIEPEA